MSKYIELTNENFEEITKEGAVMIDFFADWCSPCKMIESTMGIGRHC